MTKKKAAKKAPKKAAKTPHKNAAQKALAAAAKSVATKPVDEEPESRIQGTNDQRADAAERVRLCSEALQSALEQYRCKIVPVLNPQLELVGGSPTEPSNRGMVSCTYGIAPLV